MGECGRHQRSQARQFIDPVGSNRKAVLLMTPCGE